MTLREGGGVNIVTVIVVHFVYAELEIDVIQGFIVYPEFHVSYCACQL